MKEYKYTIIRRESRNPKRNREGRGISQSDIEALKQELAGESRGIISAITDRDLALDNLTLTSTDLSERLKTAEEGIQSHGKTLSGQAQALASQAQLLADQGQQLTSQGESLSSQSQRLTTAEQALTGKLDSDEFGKWRRGELAQSLASKQPAGSYVVPSQLASSAQQTLSEALKRAGEMDKQLKVGGRNLLIGERFSKETTPSREIWVGDITSIIDNNNLIGETVTWSFDLKSDKAHTFSAYQLGTIWFTSYTNATVEAGEWKRVSFTGVVRDTDNPTGSTDRNCILVVYGDYDSGYFPITRHHKLERGTISTDWTPAPEDVAESVSKVNTSLTSLASTLLDPDQGEIHKLTSQLATSQQQAVDEAVRQAGEMDKQIKVGGRNLIVTSRWKAGYLYGDRDENAYPVGSENYKVLVGYDTFRFDPVYIPTLGESKVTYKLYDNGGSKNGTVQIHAYDKDKKFLWWSVDGWDGTIGHTNAWTLPTDTAYIRLGVTNENVRAKVEFGTVATDWTPAPEDVAESVRTVNTSVVSLTSLLESHKTATDKSFAELSDHPLTVDENGYWRIWNLKQQQYVTTQYPSRGRDGEDAGRYLGRAKRIHPDFNGNYLLEPEGSSWQTAKEGDYVYLVGDAPNRGGDKDTYYIVREHKGNTVWEVYDIKGDKGDTPNLSLDEQYRLVADGVQVSPLSLKGEPGHSPELHVGEDDYLYIDGVQQRYIRGRDGEPGHSPSSEEVLHTPHFAKLLKGEVDTQVTEQVKPVRESLTTVTTDLSTANTAISALQDVALTTEQKSDLGYLTHSLRVLKSGSNGTLEGLALQRLIALSGDNQTISAYIASDAMGAVLKAGITNFGTANEREQVAINHNGTGHFGNLYFAGNQIDFRTSLDTAPYLSIGAEEATFIETFLVQARIVDTPVSVGSLDLTVSNAGYQRTLSVDNDGTRLTVTLDKIVVDVYGNSKLRLSLDGETLAEWVGDSKYIDTSGHTTDGGSSFRIERTPYKASNLTYERVVRAGNHTVRLEVVNPYKTCRATVNGLRVGRRYDTDAQQSLLTKSGLRLFGSPDRYFDVDYREVILPSDQYSQVMRNPYLVRIVGGAKVDKLTADEVDAPGVPLCGASFNENGGQIRAFGKRAKRQGQARAQAVYDSELNAFKVYHSIGNTNYIPIVQVSGWTSKDINWSLTPRVYNITSKYFEVRILTNNDNPSRKAISYVAYKTD